MAIITTEAIVLHSWKKGETSRYLTVYTLKEGLLKLIAKGVRSPRSRVAGTIEKLNIIELIYYEKKNRDFQYLSQASLLFSPKHIYAHAEKTMMALVCAEMVARFEEERDPNHAVYRLLRAAIEAFDGCEGDPRLLLFAFQLQYLGLLGFATSFRGCVSCRKETSQSWRLDIANAKLYCIECSHSVHSLLSLRHATVQTLRRLAHSPLAAATQFAVDAPALAEMYAFLAAYYQHHVEAFRFLKSIQVLRQMKEFEKIVRINKVDEGENEGAAADWRPGAET